MEDTFLAVFTNTSTLEVERKNNVYCTRWTGRPTNSDFQRWRAEQDLLQHVDEDKPLFNFEFVAGLPWVLPGIVDSEEAKRSVQYLGNIRHKAELEGEGDS